MRENRPARDGHERLGNLFRDGPQPRGESAREDGDGDLGKWKAHVRTNQKEKAAATGCGATPALTAASTATNSSSFKMADMPEKIAVREPQ